MPEAATAAFAALIDYAGLFPPAQLAMADALAEYRDATDGPYAWMLGRFIVPASRLDELLQAREGDARPLPLSVILDAPKDAREWLSGLQQRIARTQELHTSNSGVMAQTLEIPLPALVRERDTFDAVVGQYAACAQQAGLRDVPAFLEPPRDARWEGALPSLMAALARHRLGAKLRCGGTSADAFPRSEEVAAFLHAAAFERVPFKATAGLHHPVKHVDAATGFPMHGFLNLLEAANAAWNGANRETIAARLNDEQIRDLPLEEDALARVRREAFIAYGSCSFNEPVDDLRAMGILA